MSSKTKLRQYWAIASAVCLTLALLTYLFTLSTYATSPFVAGFLGFFAAYLTD